MPNFENENRNNTDVESVEVEGERCTIELAGFKFIFLGSEKDEEVHLTHAWNSGGRAVGMEDIPPAYYQIAKRAATKAFGFAQPFEVTPGMLHDAKKYELFHEHGEEEVERMQKEENRHASGPYETEDETKEKKSLEDSEEGTQGELPLDDPK